MNLTNEVDKPIIKKTVVVYAGRFQPFHRGHYDAYKRLVNKFGSDSVYIGTSNDASGNKSPFNFNEKKKIATTMFGIPSSHFVNIRNPYKPVEILKSFDGKTTQYIAAVGEKDATRLHGKYFKPYQGKAGYGYEEIGYVYPVPAESNPISGTDVRKALGGTDMELAKKFFLKAYPKFDKDIFKMITNKISNLNEVGPLSGKGMAGSMDKLNQKQSDDETLDEDGFPGGIGTGLSLPGGYINGAPKKKDVDKLSKKIHKKDNTYTDKNYVYDPIAEIIAQAISEEEFNEFINEYLGEAEPNPELDKELTYKNTKGQSKKIKARDALRLPKDHPAHIQAAKLVGKEAPAPEKKSKEEKPTGKEKGGKEGKKEKPESGKENKPEPVKLSGAELKSDAEKSPEEKQNADKQKKAAETKQNLDTAMKELPQDHQEAANNINNPESNERKGIMGNIKSGLQKFGKGMKHWVQHKGEMLSGSKDAVVALANGQKIGSTKNKETGKWEYSDETRKKQMGHLKHLAIDTALIVGSMALGGAGVGAAKAVLGGKASAAGHAALHGANVLGHGVTGFTTHLTKDIAKHATLEAMGLKAHHAAHVGAAASTLSLGLLEATNGETDNGKFANNLIGKVAKTMETYKMSDEEMLDAIKSYKKVEKQADYNDLLKEEVSKSKLENIAHFVKYATERLNLKDKPKVKLLMDGEFSQQKSSLGGYIPTSKEIYVVVPGRMTADICRTIAHELVHRKQDEMGFVRNESDGDTGSEVENQANAVAGIIMREYGKINKEIYKEDINLDVDKGDEVLMGKFKNKKVQVKDIGKDQHGMPTINGKQATTFRTMNEELLMEGGAYGHMSHPFDDMNLTFGDLKNIIAKALNGDLGVVREKTDGQALAISWKNGRLIAARNKGHIQNYGANAMGISDVASKFAGRGGLTDAYNFAMKDLSVAIMGLSKAQRDKIFGEGKCFMNLEVIWPTSVNVIPYGQALLVFHNTVCYDEKGTAIASDSAAARTLAGMIKQINASVQSKYTIQGPPITSIPKNENLSSKQGKYFSKLSKLQSEFGLSDGDTVSLYHQSWWENFVDTKAPVKADKLTKDALVRRWAFGDKSFKLNTISNEDLQKWAIQTDKINVVKQQKDNIRPFEEIFLGVGADVLAFVSSVLTVHPDKAIRSMKDRLKSVSQQVRTAGNPAQIQKLKTELARLNNLGGIDKIVATEGLVFFYGGKTYKLTGTFAPLNQILGIFYE